MALKARAAPTAPPHPSYYPEVYMEGTTVIMVDLRGRSVQKIISYPESVLGCNFPIVYLGFGCIGSVYCLVSYSSTVPEAFLIFVKIKHR